MLFRLMLKERPASGFKSHPAKWALSPLTSPAICVSSKTNSVELLVNEEGCQYQVRFDFALMPDQHIVV
jgi:hypothetical protein